MYVGAAGRGGVTSSPGSGPRLQISTCSNDGTLSIHGIARSTPACCVHACVYVNEGLGLL